MTTHNRIIRPRDADHARALLDEAMRRRIAVTVSYMETRKDDNGRKVRVHDPVSGKLVDTYVRTLRTVEFFDVNESKGGEWVYTGMDRCPKDHNVPGAPWTAPAIRAVRADRILEISFSSSGYNTPNGYFIDQVRKHAAAQESHRAWREVLSLSDADIWDLIGAAHNPLEAINNVATVAL